MSKLTLTYFNLLGRAGSTRVALKNAGIDFEDERIDFAALVARRGEAGASDDVPLGSLPVMKFADGTVHAQSGALARWAGAQGDKPMYPTKDLAKMLLVDEVLETCADMFSTAPQDADAEKKKTKREEWAAKGGKLHKFLNFVEGRIAGPFVLGDDLSIADVTLAGVVHMIAQNHFDHVAIDVFEGFPKILALGEAVKAHPLAASEFK